MAGTNLTACIKTEELATLFDEAFSRWRNGSADSDPRRATPRIPVEDAAPLFVASYTARDVPLNCPARIADVSAEGLGIILTSPVPLGATLRIAIQNRRGDLSFGYAVVVFTSPCEGGYRIGLRFNERLHALDSLDALLATRWVALRRAGRAALRKIAERPVAVRRIERSVSGTRAELMVQAHLFRYTAALRVNGRKVASRSGALCDRFRNLFCESAAPTAIVLAGRGCSARALLYPNAVGECGIELASP